MHNVAKWPTYIKNRNVCLYIRNSKGYNRDLFGLGHKEYAPLRIVLSSKTTRFFCGLKCGFHELLLYPFPANVALMKKPGSWFLLANCVKNTCGRGTF